VATKNSEQAGAFGRALAKEYVDAPPPVRRAIEKVIVHLLGKIEKRNGS
jgi:hypothetical protein